MDTDASAAVYSRLLIEYAAAAQTPVRLVHPDLTARAVSAICGSTIEVDLNVKEGKVTEFGFDVDACALTKAVVSVMRTAIIGKTRDDIAQAGDLLRLMLAGQESVLSGDWADLMILAPLVDFKARHNAIQLPFEAVERAFSGKKQ